MFDSQFEVEVRLKVLQYPFEEPVGQLKRNPYMIKGAATIN
jgi:hypothetical protein